MKKEPLFYIARDGQDAAGPYDLIQMAGLLRKKIITSETMSRLEGEDGWKPFGWRPQFSVAREMSPDAVSERVIEQERASQPLIPLPSLASVLRAAVAMVLLLVAGLISYFVARADLAAGICLAVAGIAAALVGTCLVYVRLLDEDNRTLLLVFFVPFYELYYFLVNFWVYLPYFYLRYAGGICAVAALVGIANGHSADADQLRAVLRLYGL